MEITPAVRHPFVATTRNVQFTSFAFDFISAHVWKQTKTPTTCCHMINSELWCALCFYSVACQQTTCMRATYEWHNRNAIRQRLWLLGNWAAHTRVMRRDISSRVTAKFWFSTAQHRIHVCWAFVCETESIARLFIFLFSRTSSLNEFMQNISRSSCVV